MKHYITVWTNKDDEKISTTFQGYPDEKTVKCTFYDGYADELGDCGDIISVCETNSSKVYF